jgi:hypothetical protein
MVAHVTDERHLKGQMLIHARAGTPRENLAELPGFEPSGLDARPAV